MQGDEILDLVRRHTKNHRLSRFDEINDAYETLCRRAGMWFLRVRDEHTLQFRDGKTTYTLPMARIRRLESVWIKDNEDFKEWRELDEATEDQFEKTVFQFRKADSTDDKDVPRFYRLGAGDSDQLEVTPTPDGTYIGRLVYIGNPTPLDLMVTPVLPENYHRTIAKLAAALWLEGTEDEAKHARARTLRRDVEGAYFHMAVDTAPNRNGVARPKQRIMRA